MYENIAILFSNLLFFSLLFIWSYLRLRHLLQYFQQHEYDNVRYVQWICAQRVFDRHLTGLLISALVFWLLVSNFISLSYLLSSLSSSVFFVAIFIYGAIREPNPLKQGKKRLVLTARAKRILYLSFIVQVFVCGPFSQFFAKSFVSLLALQLPPLSLIFSNMLLFPFEYWVQNRYRSQAKARLSPLNPVVIGITGSYGKTSLKHILGHILSSLDKVYYTPGSVNTEMGITRCIREKLKEDHHYFIVEMGAYKRGSIDRLCKLVPPDLAIVTTIGQAHYERFKTVDEVAKAKSELAFHACKNGGRAYLGPQVSKYLAFKELREKFGQDFLLQPLDSITDLESIHTLDGLNLNFSYKSIKMNLDVPIYGFQQVENILLAFVVACDLGFDPQAIAQSLRTLPQVAHRLELKTLSSGLSWIDDGFNSNPKGFRAALQFLTEYWTLKGKKGRRIMITPGMIEMGQLHEESHKELGAFAADHVDIFLAICPHRISSMISAYCQAKPNGEVHCFESFQKACHYLLDEQLEGDVVLVENDLPDLFESRVSI